MPEEKAAKHLLVGVTSDRGLCGAIHSGVAKVIKSEIATLTSAGKEVMVINVGDKLRGLLHRYEWKWSFLKFIFITLMKDKSQVQCWALLISYLVSVRLVCRNVI